MMLWHRQGIDIDQAMLSLSTYLGHAKISNTYVRGCGSRPSWLQPCKVPDLYGLEPSTRLPTRPKKRVDYNVV
jgi:hypothetical protein